MLALLVALIAPPAAQAGQEVFPEAGLTLVLDELGDLERLPSGETGSGLALAEWEGALGGAELSVSLWTYDVGDYFILQPEDVVRVTERALALDVPGFRYATRRHLDGPFGRAPYAQWASGTARSEGGGEVQHLCLGGLGSELAWGIEVRAAPPLGREGLGRVQRFFARGVRCAAEAWDPQWTAEELAERWRREVGEELAEDLEVHRTAHYVVLTNASAGRSFGRHMEKCWKDIRGVYPFDEHRGQRLLPVYLFRTEKQYEDFCVRNLDWTREAAEATQGVAWRDWYATSYAAPKDPVHVHEATHQIFAMRLQLDGGGSWFQEGVAEYMSTTENERKAVRNLIKRGRVPDFRELFARESLIDPVEARVDGESDGDEGYLIAAAVVEFARESRLGKGRFDELVRAVGSLPGEGVEEVEATIGRVLGVDLAGFRAAFEEYWAGR